MNAPESLPISLLRQWAYCPRIPFFRESLGIAPTMPKWVVQGTQFDDLQHVMSRDRRFAGIAVGAYRPQRRVSLRDAIRGLHGVADMVLLGPRDFFICDYKLHAARIERGTRLQLAGYAILAQSHYGLPCAGLIVLTGKPVRILRAEWNAELQGELDRAIAALFESVSGGSMPASDAPPSKCGICEYLNYCNDRE
ncbi:MAG TPA: CRISPR-associated protein Cas4 [Rudaea sp.]|nr:CRISPR-associated protein Cas4 [Rudaea sp.]